jgi:hypothetical protein
VPPTIGVDDNHLRESLDGPSHDGSVTRHGNTGPQVSYSFKSTTNECKESTATTFGGNKHDA